MALAQVYQFPQEEATLKVAMTRRPSFQFYPADWRKDPALAACSLAARGLWMEMLCIAHESERYGHLSINGKAMVATQIARIVGEKPSLVTKLLRELEEAGVLSRTPEGIIYSRRMIRDEEVRNIRAANGIKGADHGKKGAFHGAKGGRPRKEITPLKTPQDDFREPPPSSSSSSSPSGNSSVADATGGKPPKITDPSEIIFGYGLSMLVNAGTPDKQARSFLGGLRKAHGDDALIDKLRDCAKAKPLQPLEWLAAALPPPAAQSGKRVPKPENFDGKDYGSGVEVL